MTNYWPNSGDGWVISLGKILVVEDELTNQRMVKRRLKRHLDHDVLTADNGQEAIDAVNNSSIDVVLMDLSLPEVDGWEATRRIRETDRGDSIFIVALTAHAMEGDEEDALEAGCDLFQSKPINFEQLLDHINDYFEGDDQ